MGTSSGKYAPLPQTVEMSDIGVAGMTLGPITAPTPTLTTTSRLLVQVNEVSVDGDKFIVNDIYKCGFPVVDEIIDIVVDGDNNVITLKPGNVYKTSMRLKSVYYDSHGSVIYFRSNRYENVGHMVATSSERLVAGNVYNITGVITSIDEKCHMTIESATVVITRDKVAVNKIE